MSVNKNIKHLFLILITLLPFAYIAAIWKTVPQIIPTHFDAAGKPNAFSNRSALWGECGLIAGITLLVYLLLNNIHKIDPKRAAQKDPAMFAKVGTGMVFFMTALNLIVIISETSDAKIINIALYPLIGLLFSFMGNMMHNVKPNYFFGLRLPWTLSSDDNWKKTHQLTGKIWFVGGIVIVIVSFLLQPPYMTYFFLPAVAIMSIIPIIYSFRLYRIEFRNQKNGSK